VKANGCSFFAFVALLPCMLLCLLLCVLLRLPGCPGACVHVGTHAAVQQQGDAPPPPLSRCQNEKNLVIIADFAVQGTLARDILGSPATVITKGGNKVREWDVVPGCGCGYGCRCRCGCGSGMCDCDRRCRSHSTDAR
jgi:hypothetical protein